MWRQRQCWQRFDTADASTNGDGCVLEGNQCWGIDPVVACCEAGTTRVKVRRDRTGREWLC